jgi:hypothetical protein
MSALRVLRTVLAAVAVVCSLSAAAAWAQMGYSGADLVRIGEWLRYHSMELYRLEIPNYATPYAAALTSDNHGWHIVVFLRDGGVTNEDWQSGRLPRVFEQASTDNFVLVPRVGDSFAVTFTGCRRAACSRDYGAILYLPWSHEVFFKTVAGPGAACSATLLDPQNAAVLRTLDAALARQQQSVPHYIAPPCPSFRPKR